ncbi:MAG TPA: flagellar hook capping FlgD N-terminal domain-containing protein [Terriglobales bacterium]|nr:flagellar hook capping FlgD N-terminal domain-containing protein [Terriglobales bacterium]
MSIIPVSANSLFAARQAASSTNTSAGSADPLQGTDNTFLQLLTTQLENQSPLDPVDPNQFTTELVEFNMLDQLTQINQTLQQIAGATPATSASAATNLQGAH